MIGQRVRKTISCALLVTLPLFPLHAYSDADVDEISAIGQEGQAYGKELVEGFNSSPPQFNSGEMTLPSLNDGTFDNSSPTTININDLFPGTSSSSDAAMTDFFPAGTMPDISILEGTSTDGESMEDVGLNFQSGLWDDANSANPSTTGAAYKVMMDMANTVQPNMTNDPALVVTRDVFDNIDVISADFGDCSTTTTFTDIINTQRIPDYKTCERIIDKTASCTVNHIYDAGIIKHYSGPYNILPAGNNSINVWIGKVGNNYWTGWCSIYENVTEFTVVNPGAITSVTLDQAIWDDYIQVWVGESGNEVKIYNGPNQYFPPELGNPDFLDARVNNEPYAACELSTSWNKNPNVDLTTMFQSLSPGDIVRFKIRVSVAGKGEGYARLKINYDPELAILQDVWEPQSCIDASKGLYDGFASGSVSCASIPAGSEDGCIFINEVEVCNEDLAPSPFPDIPALCEQVAVDVDYDYYKGTFCYTAADGTEVCAEAGNGELDSCISYEENSQCGFINQKCMEGTEASDGTCYIFEEVWDCGTDVDISDVESDTFYECVGPIRCMGDDCLTPEKTESQSFAQTAALLNAAQFMTQDMNCTEATGEQDVTCQVFGGNPYDCKKAMGGIQDCCDVPTNISTGTYIQALFAMGKLDTSLMALNEGNMVRGAYQTLREPVANTVSSVTEPFASYIENISGSVTEFFEPVTTFVDELKQQISDAISETISDMMGQAASDMGADAATSAAVDGVQDQATEQATNSILQGASSAAGFLMTAYTVYVVAVMVIQMIYECEEDEFVLAAKKGAKSCTYVGSYCNSEVLGMCMEKRESYCCFSSPLSRIINQQIRPQISRPFRDVRNPDCGGIDMSEIASIDWSLVDLGEWTALLTEYNLMPDVNAMDLQSLTGAGNDLNVINGTRVDAAERTQQRLDGIDVDAIRREAAENTSVDPTGGGG